MAQVPQVGGGALLVAKSSLKKGKDCGFKEGEDCFAVDQD